MNKIKVRSWTEERDTSRGWVSVGYSGAINSWDGSTCHKSLGRTHVGWFYHDEITDLLIMPKEQDTK